MKTYHQRGRWFYPATATLGATLLALAAHSAFAADITVDSTADTLNTSACTLRAAITAANTNTATAGCVAGSPDSGDNADDDLILFGASIADDAVITLNGEALPTISSGSTLRILGPITIDAGGQSRILANQGNLTLDGLTLINGRTMSGTASAKDRSGGAILNDTGGVLTVNGGEMRNNTADRAGGAIEENSGATGSAPAVTLNEVIFSGNDAGTNPGSGGALHVTGSASTRINDSTFESNIAANGGALCNGGGLMQVMGTVLTGNVANGDPPNNGAGNAGQGGGAIHNAATAAGSEVRIQDSVISGNVASGTAGSGGGIYNAVGGTITLSNSLVADNQAVRAGGAIETGGSASVTGDSTVNISFSFLAGNRAGAVSVNGATTPANPGNGGGLHVTGNGSVTIESTLVADNTAASEGGGLWNDTGTMQLVGTSVLRNVASGAAADSGGGGLFNNAGTLNITVSRIAGNVADGESGSGGGVFNAPGATLNIADTEIAANTAVRAGGGIENNAGSVILDRVALGGSQPSFGNDGGNNPGNGGGLHTTGAGNVEINLSSVGHNMAANEGGGLWNSAGGTLTILTSTLSGNSSGTGGGLFQEGAGSSTGEFISITRNRASQNGGGGAGDATQSASFMFSNSLIAENEAPSGANLGEGVETGANTGNTIASAASLGDFRLLGGLTAVQPLQVDSIAVDTIADAACSDEPDQRGAERPFDASDDDESGNCDAGAFEYDEEPAITVTRNGPEALTADIGDDFVPVLGLTLANNNPEGSEDITVGGFSGQVQFNQPLESLNVALPALAVYQDDNANGRYDEGESRANAAISVDSTALVFTVAFDGGAGILLAPGDSASYVIVARGGGRLGLARAASTAAAYAGGAMIALLGLFGLGGGLSRRTRWVLAAVIIGVALVGCSDSDDNVRAGAGSGSETPVAGDGPIQGALQLVAYTLDQPTSNNGSGGTGGLLPNSAFLNGDGLPVRGPALTLTFEGGQTVEL